MDKTASPRRDRFTRVALYTLLVLGLWSSAGAGAWFQSIGLPPPPADVVASHLVGTRCADDVLPDRGLVGYITDAHGGAAVGGVDEGRRYFLAQYQVAPAVLQLEGRHPWVLADLDRAEDAEAVADRLGLDVARRCPGGLVVFRRR